MEPPELHKKLFGKRPYTFALYSESDDQRILNIRDRGLRPFGHGFDDTQAQIFTGHYPILIFHFDLVFEDIAGPEEVSELLWEDAGPVPLEVEFAFFSKEELTHFLYLLHYAQGSREFFIANEEAGFSNLIAECRPGERLTYAWFAKEPLP